MQSLCRLRGWAQPDDVQEEFNDLQQYNDTISHCVICTSEGKQETEQCIHSSYSVFKRISLKFKYIMFAKETMRPFRLVMAYFFFHTMSGLQPVKPNMVNLCKALGMKFDSKAIVVSYTIIIT